MVTHVTEDFKIFLDIFKIFKVADCFVLHTNISLKLLCLLGRITTIYIFKVNIDASFKSHHFLGLP